VHDFWDTIKKSTLWMMGIEEGEEVQAKSIKNTYSIK
jgi:hypothetical protein